MRESDGTKWLPAARLRELLEELPADSRVIPNSVGNLVVYSENGEHMTAYIDFFDVGVVEHVSPKKL